MHCDFQAFVWSTMVPSVCLISFLWTFYVTGWSMASNIFTRNTYPNSQTFLWRSFCCSKRQWHSLYCIIFTWEVPWKARGALYLSKQYISYSCQWCSSGEPLTTVRFYHLDLVRCAFKKKKKIWLDARISVCTCIDTYEIWICKT